MATSLSTNAAASPKTKVNTPSSGSPGADKSKKANGEKSPRGEAKPASSQNRVANVGENQRAQANRSAGSASTAVGFQQSTEAASAKKQASTTKVQPIKSLALSPVKAAVGVTVAAAVGKSVPLSQSGSAVSVDADKSSATSAQDSKQDPLSSAKAVANSTADWASQGAKAIKNVFTSGDAVKNAAATPLPEKYRSPAQSASAESSATSSTAKILNPTSSVKLSGDTFYHDVREKEFREAPPILNMDVGQIKATALKTTDPAINKHLNKEIKDKGSFLMNPELHVQYEKALAVGGASVDANFKDNPALVPQTNVNQNIVTRGVEATKSAVSKTVGEATATIKGVGGVVGAAGLILNPDMKRGDFVDKMKKVDSIPKLSKVIGPGLAFEGGPAATLGGYVKVPVPFTKKNIELGTYGLAAGIVGTGLIDDDVRPGATRVVDILKNSGTAMSTSPNPAVSRAGKVLNTVGEKTAKIPGADKIKAWAVGLAGVKFWRLNLTDREPDADVSAPFRTLKSNNGDLASSKGHQDSYKVDAKTGQVVYQTPKGMKTFEGNYNGKQSSVVIDPFGKAVPYEQQNMINRTFGSHVRDVDDVARTMNANGNANPQFNELTKITPQRLIALNPQAVIRYKDDNGVERVALSDQNINTGLTFDKIDEKTRVVNKDAKLVSADYFNDPVSGQKIKVLNN